MTLTNGLKILDNKIKVNQAQYDLGRDAAKYLLCLLKIFWKNMNTGEDLGHCPRVVEKTKFEYSSLGAVLSSNAKKKTNKSKTNRQMFNM